ncbi:rab GTPase-activating protein 1-like [Symsagittifera roscoffensis]|uniref:rab GTPase-activating protein 1-like n=1 Tax=Symsagittifera roscoffensis TaxID=84072 RepID=UPI00307C543C
MSSLEDDLKQKSENEEISVKTNDEQGNGAPTGSDSSSINNEFCLVNEGDLASGSSVGSTSVSRSAYNMTPEDSREELEEKLRDAAFESEDSKSFLSATQESNSTTGEKTDKRDDIDLVGLLTGTSEEMQEQVDSTYLHGVTYLGCGSVDMTMGYKGALEVMLDLKREAMSAVPVTLVVPTNSSGNLRLITPGTDEVKFSVSIRNIACCTRGTTQEMQDCLGFVVSQPTRRPQGTISATEEEQSVPTECYLCHVVQFAALETISAALSSFSQAFGMHSMPPGGLHAALGEEPLLLVQFNVSVKEGETKQVQSVTGGSASSTSTEIKFAYNVPRDRTCLKLRQSVLKKVEIAVKVVSQPQLPIERTCGFFVQFDDTAANVKNRNYELLDHLENTSGENNEVLASGIIDPSSPQFSLFNLLTGKAGLLYVRFALDVVFMGIETPVRFHIPVVCRIVGKGERFFYPNRRPLVISYIINLKAIPDTDSSYRVEALKCEGETNSGSMAGSLAGSIFRISSAHSYDFSAEEEDSLSSVNGAGDFANEFYGGSEADSLNQGAEDDPNESVDDVVLMSGYGSVSKDCSADILEKWDQVLKEWKDTGTPVTPIDSPEQNTFSFGLPGKGRPQPKKVRHLVRTVGIPEALRGEVWLRQVGTEDAEELCAKYREFLDQEFTNEDQIKRDIHRTFPANDFFKDDQGPGQEALLKIAKAYAQYDHEIGYCQGFTYIAAVLLLHMPEEQAFCVFVRLMGLFKLRELYKQDFYELKLKWYQLDSLVKDHIPTLYYHFQSIGLKSHMFSSQWFLTLYTAKFPLYLVYRVYDIIFSEGLSFLLNIALALLREASEELCRKSFEECNTYIKANIPRKYRDAACAEDLIRKALQMKINPKKLSLYAKEYYELVQREERLKDPMERLKLEQQESHSKIMSLEAEAVNLANELVSAKLDSQRKLETVEEKVSQIQNMFEKTHQELAEMQDQKQNLETEVQEVGMLEQQESHSKIMSLEAEAVNLANELVSAKLDSQRKLETVEEKVSQIQNMFEKTHQELAEMQDQKQNLETEVQELKKIVTKSTNETNQQRDIVAEYRKLCSRLEQERDAQTKIVDTLKDVATQCSNCKEKCCELLSSGDSENPNSANGHSNQNAVKSSRDSESESLHMEQELALTKLRLVEEQSQNQQLEHEVAELKQMVAAMSQSANQSASSATQWLLKRTPNFLSRNTTGNQGSISGHDLT